VRDPAVAAQLRELSAHLGSLLGQLRDGRLSTASSGPRGPFLGRPAVEVSERPRRFDVVLLRPRTPRSIANARLRSRLGQLVTAGTSAVPSRSTSSRA